MSTEPATPKVEVKPNTPSKMGSVVKGAGKVLGAVGKKLPIIGALLAAQSAYASAQSGDYVGAGLDIASGLASTIPGVGTAASLGVDAINAARKPSIEPVQSQTASALVMTGTRDAEMVSQQAKQTTQMNVVSAPTINDNKSIFAMKPEFRNSESTYERLLFANQFGRIN